MFGIILSGIIGGCIGGPAGIAAGVCAWLLIVYIINSIRGY